MYKTSLTLESLLMNARGLTSVVICFLLSSSCKKTNHIAPVSGTINGTPTITLYGVGGKPTDYILLSTDPFKNELAYDGMVSQYIKSSPDTVIFISVTSTTTVRAGLTKQGNVTYLNINPLSPKYFASLQYSSN